MAERNEDTHPRPPAFVDERDREHVERVTDESLRSAITCAVTAYRRPDTLEPGDPAPRLELLDLSTGRPAPLVAPGEDRPLVLFFGSYT